MRILSFFAVRIVFPVGEGGRAGVIELFSHYYLICQLSEPTHPGDQGSFALDRAEHFHFFMGGDFWDVISSTVHL